MSPISAKIRMASSSRSRFQASAGHEEPYIKASSSKAMEAISLSTESMASLRLFKSLRFVSRMI
ncbi:MAG: hypothetical protein QXI39_09940 [Candidatus Bathyarchaeia archaeon]